jgi:hypothetical protein
MSIDFIVKLTADTIGRFKALFRGSLLTSKFSLAISYIKGRW